MADVAEECSLGAVDFSQRFQPLPLLFRYADILDRSGDLTGDQLVKYCEQIASASGGLFGLPFRAISMEERNLLTRIAGDLKSGRK